MQLKKVKRVSKYKDINAYLDALYRKNKTLIDNNLSPEWIAAYRGSPKRAFKKLIKERMEWFNYKTGKNFTLSQAIKAMENSKAFNKTWTRKDVAYQNFQQLVKKDKNVYKEFKKRLRDERGRFKKYNAKDLKFLGYYESAEGNSAVYQFGDLIIFEKKSPDKNTGASISSLTESEFNLNVKYGIYTYVGEHNPTPTSFRTRRKY